MQKKIHGITWILWRKYDKIVVIINMGTKDDMNKRIIRVAICDDEPIIQNIIKNSCEKYLIQIDIPYSIKLFNSGDIFLNNNEEIDILFLDVDMPGINGFEVAKEINKRYKNIFIIFITSHSEMIQEAFKVRAFRYLFKPLNDEEFFEAIKEAVDELFNSSEIILEQRDGSVLIDKRNIIYIESLGDGTVLYTDSEKYVNNFPLKKWIEILDDISFYQCHRSYIVNFSYVKKIEISKLILKNDYTLPVSVRNRKITKEKLYGYIRQNSRYI